MKYEDGAKRLGESRSRIAAIRNEMREVQKGIEPQEVRDYTFSTPDGAVRLADLFDSKRDLFMVHNMGSKCAYCTLWADGYNGIYDHLASRAAFVVSSPDDPAEQKRFAQSRGWRFPMVSHHGTTFANDMGYRSPEGGWLPGASVFQRDGRRILRVSDVSFGPGDDFCAMWHFLDLVPEGAEGWRPKLRYA